MVRVDVAQDEQVEPLTKVTELLQPPLDVICVRGVQTAVDQQC